MLLMIEKGIRGGMCQSMHKYAKANNKHMKNYDKKIESSYLTCLNANNSYGWVMSQKLPVNGFMWYNHHLSDFNEDFIKSYNENSDEEYFLEVDIEYPKTLWGSHKDLPFLSKRRKLEKVEKLVCSIEDKEKYVIHTKALKQLLNNGLKLEVHRVIKFQQKAWLTSYIDVNTKLRKEAKNKFEKYLFKLMNNSVFGKTMENVRKNRDIRLVTTEKGRVKLVSQPKYHTTKQFSENLLAIEMKKAKVKMNKPVYLGMSILDATWILIVLFLIFLMKTFLKILTMMLKAGLIHLTMIKMIIDHFK